jgi:hypothetical protein
MTNFIKVGNTENNAKPSRQPVVGAGERNTKQVKEKVSVADAICER